LLFKLVTSDQRGYMEMYRCITTYVSVWKMLWTEVLGK